MKAWRHYNTQRLSSTQKYVSRLPGATGIYLSEATGCPRKASLRILKYPAARKSEAQQQAMASGIKGEEKVILVLEAMGWRITRQYTLQTRWGNGKIDALVDARDSVSLGDLYIDRPIVVEVKTTTLDQQKWLPKLDHKDQCLLYMGLLAAEDHQIPFGEVTYLLKPRHDDNDSEKEKIVSYPIAYDQERFLWLISQLDLIDSHVRQKKPVPLELAGYKSPDKVPCQYPNGSRCGYWQICYGNDDRELIGAGQTVMEF